MREKIKIFFKIPTIVGTGMKICANVESWELVFHDSSLLSSARLRGGNIGLAFNRREENIREVVLSG